jgi:hypothetical protein
MPVLNIHDEGISGNVRLASGRPSQSVANTKAPIAPSSAPSEFAQFANPGKLRPAVDADADLDARSLGSVDMAGDDDERDRLSVYEEDEGGLAGQDAASAGDDDNFQRATQSQPTIDFGYMNNHSSASGAQPSRASRAAAEEREKARLLAKIRRQDARRPPEMRRQVDERTGLAMLRAVSAGASYETRSKQAVQLMRRMTVFLARAVEEICKRFPSASVDLQGWADHVYLCLDQYDELLYDIFDEYGDGVQANPLVMFAMALGSNAVMYSLTRKLVNNPMGAHVLSGLAGFMQGMGKPANNPSVRPPERPPAVPVAPTASTEFDSLSGSMQGLDIGSMLSGMASNVPKPSASLSPVDQKELDGLMDLLRREQDGHASAAVESEKAAAGADDSPPQSPGVLKSIPEEAPDGATRADDSTKKEKRRSARLAL